MNYYLKAESAEALTQALIDAELAYDLDGVTRYSCPTDIIGTIYRPTGQVLEGELGSYPEMAAIPGYHANIIATLTEEQLAKLPTIAAPANPYRVWAS